jgi:hypothetical protein
LHDLSGAQCSLIAHPPTEAAPTSTCPVRSCGRRPKYDVMAFCLIRFTGSSAYAET